MLDPINDRLSKFLYMSRRDVKTFVDRFIIIVFFSSIAYMIITAFYWLDDRTTDAMVRYEMELQLTDVNIRRDNSLRIYYDEKLKEEGKLTEYDKRHLQRIQDRLDRNYEKITILNEKLAELRE